MDVGLWGYLINDRHGETTVRYTTMIVTCDVNSECSRCITVLDTIVVYTSVPVLFWLF